MNFQRSLASENFNAAAAKAVATCFRYLGSYAQILAASLVFSGLNCAASAISSLSKGFA